LKRREGERERGEGKNKCDNYWKENPE